MRTYVADEIQNEICRLYQNGNTLIAISRKLSISDYVIKRILKEHDIPLRNPGNQFGRKYQLNDNYFDSQNHNMAYLLGLIASDGNVSKRDNEINIVASIIDFDFLDSIRKEIQSTRPIKKYTDNNGNESCRLTFSSAHIKKVLAEYNIIPAKTKVYSFSYKLNREFWIDFIRGYFDGDGSVSTSGKDSIKWQIGAYNKDILDFVIDFFYEEYSIPKINIYKYNDKHFYQLTYSTNATKRIWDILYTENSLYLPRKKINLKN